MEQSDLAEPRIVKPRSRQYMHRTVVAIHGNQWIDDFGQGGHIDDLKHTLKEMPPSLFAMQGAGDFVAWLDEYWHAQEPDAWQVRITEQERAIISPGKFVAAARVTATVHYFGFKGNGRQYHKIIDPISMYGHTLSTIWPGDDPPLIRTLQWGQAIRDFCDSNGMEVRPTIGAIAGQFLTDRRFYPHARRKVPWQTNDRARQVLPGNHYALAAKPSPHEEFTAWYLDQAGAHHYHAQRTRLPDANSLYAIGYFQNLSDIAFDDVVDNFYGLYCLHLECPSPCDPMLHWINPSMPYDFVFSNELPILRDMGYKVNGIIAAWGSNHVDNGIARYATFARRELERYGSPTWLKPLLLATYGTLATRASYGETIFKLAKRGEPATVRTGVREITGTLVKKPRKLEPKIANVIHRGMIEAATRADSIGLAHYLTQQNFNVLSIYADAVMVEVDDDRPLPFIPEPWRLKRTLNHLQFVNRQAFVSGEMTKLPGVRREINQYAKNSNGHAPHKVQYEVLSGRRVVLDGTIDKVTGRQKPERRI